MTGATIELEILKDRETVYADIMEVGDKEHVTTITPGNYQIKAKLIKWGNTYAQKEIKTGIKQEPTQLNLNPIVMLPLGLIDLYLFGEIMRKKQKNRLENKIRDIKHILQRIQ